MQIPINDKSGNPNDYLISGDHVHAFHQNVSDNVPEQIGVATTPMKIDVIDFEKDRADKNRVSEATSQFFNESGVSHLLFNGEAGGSIGLNQSIKTDEAVAFSLLKQIERWVNRFVKKHSEIYQIAYKFRTVFPDVSIFNREKLIDSLLKNAQYGLPVKSQLNSILGNKPSGMTALTFLENEVLSLNEKLIPLSSSHTQTSESPTGRKKINEDELSDSGMNTRDNLGNENRAN